MQYSELKGVELTDGKLEQLQFALPAATLNCNVNCSTAN